MTCSIAITTHNRPVMLLRLLRQIHKEARKSGIDVRVHVFDDASQPETHVPEGLADSLTRYEINHGKKLWWRIINDAFAAMAADEPDYIVMLPDDVELVPTFFDQAIAVWEAIENGRKICLNLSLDQREGKACWTDFKPQRQQHNGVDVYLTQWVDMCFIATMRFLEVLNREVAPISLDRWQLHPNLSSGVGQQISQRLYHKWRMYMVTKTLVTHGNHPSVMHPEIRKRMPLHTKG